MRKIIYFFVLFYIINGCTKPKEPFEGTIFINPNIITEKDSTSFNYLYYLGQDLRNMFDRRVDNWIEVNAYLFSALYNDSLRIEIQVNPEFYNLDIAQLNAEKYAIVIGRLTTELRRDVKTVWIHKGMELFGGGNNNLLIHTDYSEQIYEVEGILEETLVHEASHTSLDSKHANNTDWKKAQNRDNIFISKYAKKHPQREDIAESYLAYLAIRYRSDRIPKSLKDIIENTIPNRIDYFDRQNFNMYPIE